MKGSISCKSFKFIYNNSVVIKTPQILYRILPSNSFCGVGFVVNRKLGAAHRRNMFKRRSRFLYNQLLVVEEKKFDIIMIPKTINLGWLEIKDSFKLMVKKINDI